MWLDPGEGSSDYLPSLAFASVHASECNTKDCRCASGFASRGPAGENLSAARRLHRRADRRSPQLQVLGAVLTTFRPDVVMLNFGVHWHHSDIALRGKYRDDLDRALEALATYHVSASSSHVPPLLLYRETLPQHFATKEHLSGPEPAQ